MRTYDQRRNTLPHRVADRKAYAQTLEGIAAHARACQTYQAKHPDRRAASITVGNAVRDGKLTRLPCFVCGSKAQAHHPDYSRPLDVVWLCVAHHRQAHALISELEAA